MKKSIRREILAGLSTFFTMAYLLLLYPQILSEGGIDIGAALTATIISLVASTLFLAFYSNFPAVLAPGLSIGPFLVYTAILKQNITWQAALGLVFWAGLSIFILSILKVRQKILLHIPSTLKFAAISGIGLFLICISLKNLNIWDPQSIDQVGTLLTKQNAIALFGLLLFFLLHKKQINSSFLIVILTCWALALFLGLSEWHGIATWPPSLSPTFLQLEFLAILKPELWGTLLTIVLISLIDSSISLTVLAHLAKSISPKGEISNINRITIPDGVGSALSGLLGTGTLSFLLESSSGIKAGGRTKITGITVALCSLSCLFLYPLISSIPLFATAPVLMALGTFMACEAKLIPWKNWTESVPALITMLTMPLTFNIYQGFALGFLSYIFLKSTTGRWKEIHSVCWALSAVFLLNLMITLVI